MGKHLLKVGIGLQIGIGICFLIRDHQMSGLIDRQNQVLSKATLLIVEQDRLIRLQRMRIEDLEMRLELSNKMLIWLKGDLGEEM